MKCYLVISNLHHIGWSTIKRWWWCSARSGESQYFYLIRNLIWIPFKQTINLFQFVDLFAGQLPCTLITTTDHCTVVAAQRSGRVEANALQRVVGAGVPQIMPIVCPLWPGRNKHGIINRIGLLKPKSSFSLHPPPHLNWPWNRLQSTMHRALHCSRGVIQ